MSYINTLYQEIQRINNIILNSSEKIQIAKSLTNLQPLLQNNQSSNIQSGNNQSSNHQLGNNKQDIINLLARQLSNTIVNKRKQANYLNQNKLNQNKYTLKESFTLEEHQKNNIEEVDYSIPSYVDQLKQGDVSIMHILGMSSMNTIQRLLNPDSLIERHYVCLDSRYRIGANSDTYTIQSWNYAATNNQMSGFITSQNEIKNIKGIRLYQLRIPWDTDASTFPTMRCMSILFHEFATQSITTHTQRKFHFLPQMIWSETVITGMELMLESNQDYTYNFQTPILTFDKLTYSFGNPYTLMTIYHDRDTCTFTYSAFYLYIVCSKAHLFNNPTWITITGFTTNAPNTDSSFIDDVNSQYGIYCTVNSATTLRAEPYFPQTAITPQVGLVANVYFDRRRIFMPLEFICLK